MGGGTKNWKKFFAFLDELGHSEYFLKKKKSMENGSDPPPVKKNMENSILFFSTLKASLRTCPGGGLHNLSQNTVWVDVDTSSTLLSVWQQIRTRL